MARTYYTLCAYEPEFGRWFDEFGSYKKAEVQAELEDKRDGLGRGGKCKIVTTDGTRDGLLAALAKLNAGL